MEDPVTAYRRQEQEKGFLAKMKYASGDFNRWTTRFEDQMETCETVGVPFSDEAKIHYFADNLKDTVYDLRRDHGELHELEYESPVPENL